jgi:hypothetical protein
MSKFGAETSKMVDRTPTIELVVSALRTDVNAARVEALILENRRATIRDLLVSLEVNATLSIKNRGAVEVMDAVRKCWTEEHNNQSFEITVSDLQQFKEGSELPEFIVT